MFYKKRFKRLLISLFIVIIGNIVAFSPGLIGISFGENSLMTALGVTIIIASIAILWLEVRYLFSYSPEPPIDISKIDDHQDYLRSIEVFDGIKEIKSEVALLRSHLTQIESRRSALYRVLAEKFSPSELTYARFDGIYREVEKLFYVNIKAILNKLKLLYSQKSGLNIDPRIVSPEIIKERERLRAEYIASVREYLQVNEEILLKLDQLLLEIAKLGVVDLDEIDRLTCLREIDNLIKHTKYYKN